MLVFFGFLGLVAIILGPIAFFMLLSTRSRLDALEQRLNRRTELPFAQTDYERRGSQILTRSPMPETDETQVPQAPSDEEVPTTDPQSGAENVSEDESNDGPTREDSKPEDQAPRRSGLDTESKIGGKLTIWIGGVALAFGGLFLVRYAIENALLGPTARIMLGFLFGLTATASGEFLRRRQDGFVVAGLERANIPATLTAVGIFSMFAALYAAHALYDLIGPTATFLGLAVLALVALCVSLVHGPSLAVSGLLASYATPFLINTEANSITVLAVHVLAVSAAAIGIARIRSWLWLAMIVVVAMTLFGFAFALGVATDQPIVVDLYLASAFALGFLIFVLSFERGIAKDKETEKRPIDLLATGVLSVLILPIIATFPWDKPQMIERTELVLLFAVPFAIAIRIPAMRLIVVVTFVVGCLRYLTLGLPAVEVPGAVLEGSSLYALQVQGSVQAFALMGVTLAGALLVATVFLAPKTVAFATLTASSLAAIVGLLFVAYFRIEQLSSSNTFAVIGLLLATVFYALASHFFRVKQSQNVSVESAVSSFVIGSLVSNAFAVSVALEGPVLTLALGLIPAAAALTYKRFGLYALRVFTVVSALPYVGRLLWEPLINQQNLVDQSPLLNDLLWGYGAPAMGLGWAAYVLTRARADRWAELLQAIAIIAIITTFALLSLHAIDPSFTFSSKSKGLAAIATLVLIGGAFSLGLTRISSRGATTRTLHQFSDLLSIVGLVGGMLGLFWFRNPAIDGTPPSGLNVGDGMVSNLINYAYLIPAMVFAAISYFGRETKAAWLIKTNSTFSFFLAFAWVNMTIRHVFSPSFLQQFPIKEVELYAYSVVWLLIGLAMLGAGIGLRFFILRAASGIVIVLVTLKVFLVDLSGLDGILRPISFIGLGMVLLGIGFVYQRTLKRLQPPQREEPSEAPDDADGPAKPAL